MFWGDIIVGFPEMIKELPKEIICLNWGYMWNQREEETKWMHEAGAVQYCCPGCCGWNEFSALNWYAYNNIMRMCTYANKYGAIGLLNTDWGDYLHVNHPDFTRVGMIYGAAFSWNSNIPSYEDINRQISRIEYRDSSENYLAVVAKIQENSGYDWNVAVRYWEMKRGLHEQDEVSVGLMKERIGQMDNIDQKDANLKEIARELYAQIEQMDSSKRALVMSQIVAVDAIRIFNQIGKFATADVLGCTYESMPDSWALAKELETWFYFYKRVYRSISEESELRYIQELVCWYGDYLRQIK
jgi:glycosyl hydrolase, family 20